MPGRERALTCDLCAATVEGIPFGPRVLDCWCMACWFAAVDLRRDFPRGDVRGALGTAHGEQGVAWDLLAEAEEAWAKEAWIGCVNPPVPAPSLVPYFIGCAVTP